MLTALLYMLQPKKRINLKNTGVLHEEGGERVLNSVVEIIINNEDQRIPVESEKVNS